MVSLESARGKSRGFIFPCSLFGCNQVKAERRTDQHESLPWFRRQNEERRLSNIRAEMFRVAPLLTRHP